MLTNTSLFDVVTVAKGLGNGFPIGACLAKGKAAQVIQPGNHGSTFGGNPLACHTAQAVLDTITADQLMPRAAKLGQWIVAELGSRLSDHPLVVEIRGQGLMLGIELSRDCGDLVQLALDRGLVINVTAGKVVRLLPPLILSDSEAEELVATLADLLSEYR